MPALLHAAEPTPPNDVLETLEVIGKSEERTGDVISEELSISSDSIDRAELTRTPTPLAEIIARETGVQYKQSGGFGSYASVSIRAASAAQTGVYLDGVLLNSGGNPVVDLSTLEILNLGSIDIYRGSTPLQLGHGGIGGAVNLRTLDAKSTPGTRVRLGLGSLSQAGLQLAHQGSSENWDIVAAASYRQSDNDFNYVNDNGTPLNVDDDEKQRRQNSGVKRTSALLRTGYQHQENARTDLTVQLAVRELGVPEWRNRAANHARYDTESAQLQLSHVLDRLGNWNTKHSLYWHTDNARYDDRQSQIGLGAQDKQSKTHTMGAKTYWEYPGDAGTLGTSLDFRRESIDSTDRLDNTAAFEAQRDEWLGTLHYVWFDTSERWTITPALRWQSSALNSERIQAGEAVTDQQQSSDSGVQLGVSYQLNTHLSLSSNLGSYHRTPSFGELYSSIGLINGNPSLQPERGINADIGVNYTGESLSVSGSVFASERDELIVTAFDSRGVGRPLNSGEARALGVELAAQWAVSPHLRIRSNMTWQSPKSVDRNAGFYNKFLPGEAQLSWYARAELTRARWSCWYDLDIQKKRFYDRANILPAADSTQHSVGLNWQEKDFLVTFSINNLGNDNIEDFNGFPKPGRTWSLSLTHSL